MHMLVGQILLLSTFGFTHPRLYKFNLNWQLEQAEHYNISNEWFQQRLDHFDHMNQRTWMQRYFLESKYSRNDGPVFLMVSGEGPANPVWMYQGHWITMAKKFGAVCFMIEHRFYGKSQPTTDTSVQSLSFLSSEQALADIANFIPSMTKRYQLKERKWILFGGSYSGALAIWARLKFPHFVSGAVSSSAPLKALSDFSAYLEVASDSLTKFGSKVCSQNMAHASQSIVSHLQSDAGRRYLGKVFQLCDRLSDEPWQDAYFQEALAGNVMDVVQYNKDNRSFEGAGSGNITIKHICEVMSDTEVGDLLHRYAKINELMLKAHRLECLDTNFTKYLEEMKNTSWTAASGSRMWVYQTCTEFGWFQPTNSPNQPFLGFPLKYFFDLCFNIYGILAKQVVQGVIRTNENYGARNIGHIVTNVTLYNGGVDPWSNVSFTLGHNKKESLVSRTKFGIVSIFVPDSAHCAIMYPPSINDPYLLVQARLVVERTLCDWFGLPTTEDSH